MENQLNVNLEAFRKILGEYLGKSTIWRGSLIHTVSRMSIRSLESACEDLIQTWQTNPHFLNYVAARDESWVFQYDPETKRRSMNRKTQLFPRPRKCRWQWSRIRRTTITFLRKRFLIHIEFFS